MAKQFIAVLMYVFVYVLSLAFKREEWVDGAEDVGTLPHHRCTDVQITLKHWMHILVGK